MGYTCCAQVVYDEEQKGPVTSITHVSGQLLGAIGQKIYMWELDGDQLIAKAFIDTQVYLFIIARCAFLAH